MFLFFAYLVATVALVLVLSPKPPQTEEIGLKDLGVPTAEPGRSIPRVYGTVLIKSPNVVWYGDLKKEKIYV